MNTVNYEQVKDWVRATKRAFLENGEMMPRVRHEDLEISGTLVVHDNTLVLQYVRSGGKFGYQFIAPRWVEDGQLQVKNGHRYIDVREYMALDAGGAA